jgi:hypothetical protein
VRGGYRVQEDNTKGIDYCQEAPQTFFTFFGHDPAIPGHQLKSRTWAFGRADPSRGIGGLTSVGALSRSSLVDATPPSEGTYRTRYGAVLQRNRLRMTDRVVGRQSPAFVDVAVPRHSGLVPC